LEAWINRGVILRSLGRKKEAIENYKHALELDPNCDKAWYNLGLVLPDDELETKIGCYKRALEINPRHAKAWYNTGIVFRKLGLETVAIKCFEQAITLDKRLKTILNIQSTEKTYTEYA
jgi:tetratricopeptide (TPR) repeat protein